MILDVYTVMLWTSKGSVSLDNREHWRFR